MASTWKRWLPGLFGTSARGGHEIHSYQPVPVMPSDNHSLDDDREETGTDQRTARNADLDLSDPQDQENAVTSTEAEILATASYIGRSGNGSVHSDSDTMKNYSDTLKSSTEASYALEKRSLNSGKHTSLVVPWNEVSELDEDIQSNQCSCHISGLIYAVISAFFLSLCSVLVKVLDKLEPAELAMIRFLGILIPSFMLSVYRGHSIFPAGHRKMLMLRSCLGTTALICKFYAVRQMALADASVILLSAPVFVAIFARIFLGEPCGLLNVVTIALTVVGMMLITRPPALFGGGPQPRSVLVGSVLAFVSTLFGANVYVTMRLLRAVPPTVIMTCFSAVAAPCGLLVAAVVGGLRGPRTLAEAALLLVLSVSSFLGQLCLTRAVQSEQASLVAIVRTISEVLLAVTWQLVLFADVPGPLTVFGMVLVIFSVVLVGFKKMVQSKPNESPLRQLFACLV